MHSRADCEEAYIRGVTVSCPWCEECTAKDLFTGRDRYTGEAWFIVARCLSCGLVYTRRRPDDEDLGKYYPKEYYAAMSTSSRQSSLRRSRSRQLVLSTVFGYPPQEQSRPFGRAAARMAARVSRRDASHVPWVSSGRLLEVGAGAGAVISEYYDLGWNVVGVELSPDAAAEARAADLDVRTGTLEVQNFEDGSFDAVVFNHVLEHVADPRTTLLEAARVLAHGGWLSVRVPNADAWEAHLYGSDWFPWELPRHLVHFCPRSLSRVIEDCGFAISRVRTEFRPSNLGLNAVDVVKKRTGVRLDARVLGIALAPMGLLAALTGRATDLAVLAQKTPT